MIEFLKRWKKYLFIGIFILILIAIFSFIIIFTYISNKVDVTLKLDLSCEFREEVYVTDFVKKIRGRIIEDPLIDTTKVGKRKVVLMYRNRYGFISRKYFEIEVKDVIAPTVVVKNPYTIEVGNVENLVDTIFCADDYDDNINCQIKGNYDLNKIGSYSLKISAVDHSNNKTEKDFILNVVEKKKSNNKNVVDNNFIDFNKVYKKYKNKNTLIGLDLSKWQGNVDFDEIKRQGVEFVMLKIGGQSEINGDFNIDPKFLENLKKAKDNNIKVGVYFYSYAKTEKEARKQVKWIISNLREEKIDLPIVFDWENWSKFTTFRISFNTLNNVAATFMDEVEKNGYEAMLYSSKYYLENIWYRQDYKVWLAYYTENNDYDGDYFMWQLCNNGRILGIDGLVDIDVIYNK